MKKPSESGKIKITTRNLDVNTKPRIQAILDMLASYGIEGFINNEDTKNRKAEVIFEITEIGTISEKPIKEIISILFSENPLKGVEVRLRDDEKEFSLPDDGECVDWFVIEE
jgi:hypothetical protein